MDIQQQARCTAHEIRNQLSICELYSEIIRKNLEKENVSNKSLDNAIICIKRALKIMANNLLDLKSLDNLKIDKYDLKEILETGIELAKIYIVDKNIKFSININSTTTVSIDENKFLACIVNIVKNAIEAIPEKGEIKISLKTENNFAFIIISNNGKPISRDQQIKIFQQGFTTKSTGSGLGLYICKQNLESQNINLELLKSNKNETAFEIKIPIEK